MEGIDTLDKDFFANKNVCIEPKFLKEGDRVLIVDPTIIDEETDFYAIIPAKVLKVDPRPSSIPGRMYYWFVAEGSKNDEGLNCNKEIFMGEELKYYKYLENTSPYIRNETEATKAE